MNALVTGSAGFLGRHFYAALSETGYNVFGIDVRNSPTTTHMQDVRILFNSDIDTHWDVVIHCAAVVNGRETIENSPMDQVIDFELDAGLFRWATPERVGKIVYLSSSAAYPIYLQSGVSPIRLRESNINLKNPGMPDALYGWTKLTGEHLAHHARNAGADVLVIRPFSGYGTDQDLCYPFPAIMRRALNKDNPFMVWGSGQQVRDFIHVDDIVGAVLALLDANVTGPVNIGTGIPTSMTDLAKAAARAMGYEPEVTPTANKPEGVLYRVADTTTLANYYRPRVELAEGIDKALRGVV